MSSDTDDIIFQVERLAHMRASNINDTDAPFLRRIAAELKRLREVESKLPKTADAQPIVIDGQVWVLLLNGQPEQRRVVGIRDRTGIMMVEVEAANLGSKPLMLNTETLPANRCYSTRQAAEAAKGGSDDTQ